jgi:hypothetical protein
MSSSQRWPLPVGRGPMVPPACEPMHGRGFARVEQLGAVYLGSQSLADLAWVGLAQGIPRRSGAS